ncbi:MAG: hypothetical protein M1839_003643 [Geoglossum umbratile]|nr:MAG: hypothetical protein M1839_003643 [Geoglossum umbratile]
MISRTSLLKAAGQINAGLPSSLVRPAVGTLARTRKRKVSKPFQTLAARYDSLRQVAFQSPTETPLELVGDIQPLGFITDVRTSPNGESVAIEFHDKVFTFHAQWLHDAQVGHIPSRDATEVYSHKLSTARILQVNIAGHGVRTTLDVTWDNGQITQFPAIWLRAYAPVVAKHNGVGAAEASSAAEGWLANTLKIPEISYTELFPENCEISPMTVDRIYDTLLHESAVGIVKVVGLPAPVVEDERNTVNTLVTRILKQIFGGVFSHPRRPPDTSFNIASHHEKDVKKGLELLNYNTNRTLLPHADMSHYTHPSRIQGLYALEGESQNTFVSCSAAIATFREEAPHLFEHLCTAPMALGRVAHFYKPSLYQATIDTAVVMQPGFPDRVKRFRWHPHLTGSLLSPYDKFAEARMAHRKFQEILLRDTHQLKIAFKPGDLYIWDNFRVLHGRERVLTVPRTSVGQTVPEQIVVDGYRVLKMKLLKGYIDEKWLIHMPPPQLYDLVNHVRALET